MRLQTTLHGRAEGGAPPPRRRADRARRAGRGGGSPRRRLLGRHEAAPRPRAGARAPPADPLPRRADHRARPAEPQLALGGGRAARRRRGHDRLPHHPVPRGGRPPRRSRRDHRPRHRSSPRAPPPRSSPRSASRRSRRPRPIPPTATAAGRGDVPLRRRRRAARRRRRGGLGPARARPQRPAGRSSASSTPRASTSPTCSCTRPTLDDVFLDKTGPQARGGAGEGAEVATGEHEAVPA